MREVEGVKTRGGNDTRQKRSEETIDTPKPKD
jgi:hypothetical protein